METTLRNIRSGTKQNYTCLTNALRQQWHIREVSEAREVCNQHTRHQPSYMHEMGPISWARPELTHE